MYRILIVEDDGVIAKAIASALTRWGFDAQIAEDLQDVMRAYAALEPHLVLMDVSLPFFNGYHWCAKIREAGPTPVIFLSSRADNMDIVMGVNMGGDDYIAKPVSMDVLIAKVQAMLRRCYDYEPALARLTLRDAVFLPASASLERDGLRIELTKNELKILQLLLEQKGRIVTREQIMLALWDSDEFIDDNTLTVNINRLRKTLADADLTGCIQTHKGLGYSIHD